ncbi:MAG: sigma-70 family RNA polymerase sigma factor [Gaiellaceae bacterium]
MATTAIGLRAARELDELYRGHAAEVFRYAYAVLGNRADAEDVTQTTFVNALRALERGERPRKPRNWLITIAHNLIRQRFRQQQARPREVELDHELAAVETADDGPAIDDLVRALQRIPPTQRQALVLRELDGRSYKEIAAVLGVSQSALETLIFRARRSLADELENLVTCDRAKLALSRRGDDRLGRKERRRLVAHLDECPSCARVAAHSSGRRRAFGALAALPLPFSLTLFNGAPAAYAAAGLPAIGAGAAGVTAKLAVGLAAVVVAGGAGYEGVRAVRDPATPVRPAVVAPAQIETKAKPKLVNRTAKQARIKPANAAPQVKGRSTRAPGRTTLPADSKGVRALKPQRSRGLAKAARPVRGESAQAPRRLRSIIAAKAKKPR